MITSVLSGIHAESKNLDLDELVVIHGGNRGVDTLVSEWARARHHLGVVEERYMADRARHGEGADAIRNREMYKVSDPDLVVAFPHSNPKRRRGTDDMISVAEAGGSIVWVIERRAPVTPSPSVIGGS